MSKTPRKYTEEEKAYLREIAPRKSWREITHLFNQKFHADVEVKLIGAALKRYGIKTGRTGRFEKGKDSWNKGKKGLYTGGDKGWFKKGQIPINHRPVGSERINVDGYYEIKIAEPNKWQLKHRFVWEQANGVVPENHCLIFMDGNKQNVQLENLQLISRRQLLLLNRRKLLKDNAEINEAAINIVNLIMAIDDKKKVK